MALDSLPKGKIFDDAKLIVPTFKKSEKGYSEVLESWEKNRDNAKTKTIDIRSLQVTQPNIQSNKVMKMIENIEETPIINVVQFKNGDRVIFDGHHRLMANFLLKNYQVKVNIVEL